MVEAHGAGPAFRGREFGPYTIVRRLGVGGMAETFEAVRHGSEDFSQRVCLKLALPFLHEDQAFVRLFQREARLAAKLRHGNIVGVLDYGNIEGTPYMALELVDGADLMHLLERERSLSADHVALLAIELAKGLSHAHHPPSSIGLDDSSTDLSGIVHRDLSPSNVMLSRQGEVLLTDFGVAKAMSGASQHQSAVKGKVPYMSPEQLRNDSLDGRSDLFSLGVVLYESLSGSRPYDGGNDPATIMRILQGDRTSIRKLVYDAPTELCEVIDGLLETDRENRPSSAAELLTALDSLAPSPRSQRELGAIVSALHRETLEQERKALAAERTERRSPYQVESGVIPSAVVPEPPKQVVAKPPPPKARRMNASALLAIVIVTAMLLGILLFAMRLV
jgi:serine/threonine protein kinase